MRTESISNGVALLYSNIPNRGVRNDFGKIHMLKSGDIITTVLGIRIYAVSSVTKVAISCPSDLVSTVRKQLHEGSARLSLVCPQGGAGIKNGVNCSPKIFDFGLSLW